MSYDGIWYDAENDEYWGLDLNDVVRTAPTRLDCRDRIREANVLILAHYAKTGEATLPTPTEV